MRKAIIISLIILPVLSFAKTPTVITTWEFYAREGKVVKQDKRNYVVTVRDGIPFYYIKTWKNGRFRVWDSSGTLIAVDPRTARKDANKGKAGPIILYCLLMGGVVASTALSVP